MEFVFTVFPLFGPIRYVLSYLTFVFPSPWLLRLCLALLILRMLNTDVTVLATPLNVDRRLVILSGPVCAGAFSFEPSSDDFDSETRRCCFHATKTSSSFSSLFYRWNITFKDRVTSSDINVGRFRIIFLAWLDLSRALYRITGEICLSVFYRCVLGPQNTTFFICTLFSVKFTLFYIHFTLFL